MCLLLTGGCSPFLGSINSDIKFVFVIFKSLDPGDQILLKNSKCSESLQIERERRPHRYEPNATRLGSNGRREREISRSVQNDKQAKKRMLTVQSVQSVRC
jgi:hypothetical protein